MEYIDLDKLKMENLVDNKALQEAYIEYLKKELGYDDFDAAFAASDLKNPYKTEYIEMDYEGDAEIDGTTYSFYPCKTNFARCGLFYLADKKPFEFYMVYRKEDIADHLVSSYMDAEKWYVIEK